MNVHHVSLFTAVALSAFLQLDSAASPAQDAVLITRYPVVRVEAEQAPLLAGRRARLAVLDRVLSGHELTNDQRGMEITEYLQEVVRIGLESPEDGRPDELPAGPLAKDVVQIVRAAAENLTESGDFVGALACESLADFYQEEIDSGASPEAEAVTAMNLSATASGPTTLRAASEMLQQVCDYAQEHDVPALNPSALAHLAGFCWNRADELESMH